MNFPLILKIPLDFKENFIKKRLKFHRVIAFSTKKDRLVPLRVKKEQSQQKILAVSKNYCISQLLAV